MKKQRAWRNEVLKVKEACAQTVASAVAALLEFEGMSEKDLYGNEIKVLKYRKEALDYVVGDAGKSGTENALALASFKQRLARRPANAPDASASSDGTTDAVLAAAPALGFSDIGILGSLDDYVDEFGQCRTDEQLSKKVVDANTAKKLIENLASALKAAVADLFAARTNERKAAADRAKAAPSREPRAWRSWRREEEEEGRGKKGG